MLTVISLGAMDAKKELLEILGYYRYKIDNNLCTPEEIESANKLLQENLDVYGTVEDFAKFYNVSETQVRSAINRKLIDKPKRRVYYRFLSFLKVAPRTWRERLHTS